ncbi:MAG: hypothetical protein ACREIA_08280 [Opitutaceae bacterium]
MSSRALLRAKSGQPEPLPLLRISDYKFDFVREPFRKPLGFKGSQFTEKWVAEVTLGGSNGAQATAYGGFSVLWADDRVFRNRSESGANAVMASVAEYGLQCARRVQFATPLQLQDRILTDVHNYACEITRLPDLNPAFTLNALVALDHAAWLLFAQAHKLRRFDDFVSAGFSSSLPERHPVLGCIPLVSYKTGAEEIQRLAQDGHFLLKISMGSPGGPDEMLHADKRRLAEIHDLVGRIETPHTAKGKILYYLDANGRYKGRDQIRELLKFVDQEAFLDRLALFEEPFGEFRKESVADFPVTFVGDESIRSVKDLAGMMAAGFRAVAIKPAGKGLSASLRMTREALRLGLTPLVSDSSCTPLMLDWNKNMAARLPTLPGMSMGLLEMNGQLNFAHWDEMLARHPCGDKAWARPQGGLFHLDRDFFTGGGGVGSE